MLVRVKKGLLTVDLDAHMTNDCDEFVVNLKVPWISEYRYEYIVDVVPGGVVIRFTDGITVFEIIILLIYEKIPICVARDVDVSAGGTGNGKGSN